MPRNTLDTETEEPYQRKVCSLHELAEQYEKHGNLVRGERYSECRHPLHNIKLQEPERWRKKRSKSPRRELQHCPSCHCPPQTVDYLPAGVKYTDNVEALMQKYEHFRTEPVTSAAKKSSNDPLSLRTCPCSNGHHHQRKEQSGNYRQVRRNEQDEVFLAMMKDIFNSGLTTENVEGCYGYAHSPTKTGHKRENRRRDRKPAPDSSENSNLDSEFRDRCMLDCHQQKKSQSSRAESRVMRQCTERVATLHAESKSNIEEKDCSNWRLQSDCNERYTRNGRLRFELPRYENLHEFDPHVENPDDNQDEQNQRYSNASPSRLTAPRSSTVKSSLQNAAVRSKNVEESTKNNIFPIDARDYLNDVDLRKEPLRRSRRKSTNRKNFTYQSNEGPTNEDDIREATQCEIIFEDSNPETTAGKHIYAGGDLDLHATKSHILSLIDRALSSEFGGNVDQQKAQLSTESKQGSTQQELCIEIIRALQGDCCQTLAQNLLNHCGSSADYIKQLKILRWEHLNHIQTEFRKLCSLQKFLDSCSPRQSLPAFQTQSNTVEQRAEERQQQQQEEKQEVNSVS